MDICPDMVLDRDSALVQGWTVYRSGQQCKNGHTGWRYVKTAQCLQCLRETAKR